MTKRIAPQNYVAVTRPLAKDLYAKGIAITIAGNNVHWFHIFNGWCLGLTMPHDPSDDFDAILHSFLSYLERELGTYAVFYVKKDALHHAKEGSPQCTPEP